MQETMAMSLAHSLGCGFVIIDDNILNILGPGVMLGKILLISFFIFWVRFTYPRLREDQLQKFAWKVLIPLALANIVLTGIFKVVF